MPSSLTGSEFSIKRGVQDEAERSHLAIHTARPQIVPLPASVSSFIKWDCGERDSWRLLSPRGPPGGAAPLPKSPPSAARALVNASRRSWNILSAAGLQALRSPRGSSGCEVSRPTLRARRRAGGGGRAVTQARAPGPQFLRGAAHGSGTRAAPSPFLPERG